MPKKFCIASSTLELWSNRRRESFGSSESDLGRPPKIAPPALERLTILGHFHQRKGFFFVFFTVWYPAFCLNHLPKTLFLWKVFHFLFFFQKSILWDLRCIIYEYNNQNYGLARICQIGEFDDEIKRTLFIKMVIAFVDKGEMFSKRFGSVGSAINSQMLIFLLLFLLRACDLYLVWHLREKRRKKSG